MQRVAVFVDAGYLFAQGSKALTDSKIVRSALSLSSRSVIEELKTFTKSKAQNCSILRIYWYDGVIAGAPMSIDQAAIADLDDTKLRLGFINSQGQQKGVDSLIVTDLIELARQKAISDAVLLSGDEDVRIGVQIAQNYGVRVHLLGIFPARGSQARTLRQEADTTDEWDAQTIAKFLSVRSSLSSSVEEFPKADNDSSACKKDLNANKSKKEIIENEVTSFVGRLDKVDIESIDLFWKSERGVPKDFDREILGILSKIIGERLDREEIRFMRACFFREVKARSIGC